MYIMYTVFFTKGCSDYGQKSNESNRTNSTESNGKTFIKVFSEVVPKSANSKQADLLEPI